MRPNRRRLLFAAILLAPVLALAIGISVLRSPESQAQNADPFDQLRDQFAGFETLYAVMAVPNQGAPNSLDEWYVQASSRDELSLTRGDGGVRIVWDGHHATQSDPRDKQHAKPLPVFDRMVTDVCGARSAPASRTAPSRPRPPIRL